jgi:hypothetical protein
MKVKVLIAGAGYGPHGVMTSWAPNGIVEVDDSDKDAVAFYRGWVKAGHAEFVEVVEVEKPASSPAPAKAASKATKT